MKALIIVDIQNDFMPDGVLGIKDGDKIIPLINKLQEEFEVVVACMDWHPKSHKSFASNSWRRAGESIYVEGIGQTLWPEHCIEGSFGAAFHSDLKTDKIQKIFKKGTDACIDSYSAFYDNRHIRSTRLAEYLKEKEVAEVCIVGLATDYCVKYSALDSIKEGFKTTVDLSACRGVELASGDVEKAIEEMKKAGVNVIGG